MPEKLMRCFLSVKKDLHADNEDWSAKRVSNVARAICVKRTGQKFVKHSSTIDSMFNVTFGESGKPEEVSFAFETDLEVIEEAKLKQLRPEYEVNDPDSILVVGRAIWATDSANYNRYSEKELKKASNTLIGAPCQIDHSESARDTFGIVTEAWWDSGASPPEIAYIAELDGSEVVAQRVKKKYVRGVSVAGSSEKSLCSICGEEWSWAHEHYPGQEYEEKKSKKKKSKKKKVKCFLDHINITFRHLGFTAFPAISGADANYIAASVSEALENVNAYISHATEHGYSKTHTAPAATVGAFGETISMSTDPKEVIEQLKLLEKSEFERARLEKEKATLEAKMIVLEKEKTDSDKDLEALKTAEKERLINEIVDLQEKLELTKGRETEERRADLANEHMLSITAKVEALREIWEKEEKDTPPPRSIISEGIAGQSRSRTFRGGSTKFDELDPEKKEFYEREAKLERYALGLFGHRPAAGAVQILSEWNDDLDRWDTEFADMFKTVPKLVNIRR